MRVPWWPLVFIIGTSFHLRKMSWTCRFYEKPFWKLDYFHFFLILGMNARFVKNAFTLEILLYYLEPLWHIETILESWNYYRILKPLWNLETIMESWKYYGILKVLWNLETIMESWNHYGILKPFWNHETIMESWNQYGILKVLWNLETIMESWNH